MVAGVLEILATAEEEGASHGKCITESQEDDTHTRECTEGCGRTEVDQSKKQFDNHSQKQRVEGNFQPPVHDLEPSRTRNGTVTSKSPSASRGGGHTGDATADTQDNNGDAQAERTDLVSSRVEEDGGHGVAQFRQHASVRENERDGDHEGKTGDHVHDDGANDGIRDLDSGTTNLFTHTARISIVQKKKKKTTHDVTIPVADKL